MFGDGYFNKTSVRLLKMEHWNVDTPHPPMEGPWLCKCNDILIRNQADKLVLRSGIFNFTSLEWKRHGTFQRLWFVQLCRWSTDKHTLAHITTPISPPFTVWYVKIGISSSLSLWHNGEETVITMAFFWVSVTGMTSLTGQLSHHHGCV